MEASTWKQFFTEWPSALPRQGIVIASFGEEIPFSGFFTSDAFLVLERAAPETSGARFVILRYENLNAIKLGDEIDAAAFRKIGFAGASAQR